MEKDLILKAMTQLASAIQVLGYHLQSKDDSNAILGHLQEFEKLTAQLRVLKIIPEEDLVIYNTGK